MTDSFIIKERLLKFDRLRFLYLALFTFSFLLTEIGRELYRPYIYSNHINDLGFADTIGNFFGTTTQIYFMLFLLYPTYKKGLFFFPFFVLGYSIYEIWQLFLPGSRFDYKDIIATIISGLISYGIYRYINKRNKTTHDHKRP